MDTTNDTPQKNPLASPQRETAGANTFGKYDYQYHWALCRILGVHEHSNDYVLFIELHEDVLLATSADASLARFELYQIKNVSGSPWTSKNLTSKKSKKAAADKKVTRSVLGKMMQGLSDRPYFEKLDSLELVTTCGFKLPLKISGLKLSILTIGDIHDDCVKEIQETINKELGPSPLPNTLRFVTSDLPSTGFQDATVGRISKLVDSMVPGANCNVQSIYRVLIDDLHRKGAVEFDFAEWNNLIRNKGTTHDNVERVISTYTEDRGIDVFDLDFESIATELGLQFNKKIMLRRAFERYHNAVRFERALVACENQRAVKSAVEDNFSVFEQQGAVPLIEAALNALSEDDKKAFIDAESLKAAIIYELLSKCYEK